MVGSISCPKHGVRWNKVVVARLFEVHKKYVYSQVKLPKDEKFECYDPYTPRLLLSISPSSLLFCSLLPFFISVKQLVYFSCKATEEDSIQLGVRRGRLGPFNHIRSLDLRICTPSALIVRRVFKPLLELLCDMELIKDCDIK